MPRPENEVHEHIERLKLFNYGAKGKTKNVLHAIEVIKWSPNDEMIKGIVKSRTPKRDATVLNAYKELFGEKNAVESYRAAAKGCDHPQAIKKMLNLMQEIKKKTGKKLQYTSEKWNILKIVRGKSR